MSEVKETNCLQCGSCCDFGRDLDPFAVSVVDERTVCYAYWTGKLQQNFDPDDRLTFYTCKDHGTPDKPDLCVDARNGDISPCRAGIMAWQRTIELRGHDAVAEEVHEALALALEQQGVLRDKAEEG